MTYGFKGQVDADEDDEGAEPYCPGGTGYGHGLWERDVDSNAADEVLARSRVCVVVVRCDGARSGMHRFCSDSRVGASRCEELELFRTRTARK